MAGHGMRGFFLSLDVEGHEMFFEMLLAATDQQRGNVLAVLAQLLEAAEDPEEIARLEEVRKTITLRPSVFFKTIPRNQFF